MKRTFAFILSLVIVLSLCACAGTSSPVETKPKAEAPVTQSPASATEDASNDVSGTITMAVTYSDTNLERFKEIIDGFESESNVTVELITPASEYESTLKTMMASNTLPDVFMTHGWSLLRYSEYLQPVNSQPWFDTMDKSLEPLMADGDGNIYALCVSTSVSGVYFNADALKKAGIDDPYSIRTWSDFEAACDKVKAAGMTPIAVGGGSGSSQFSSIFGGIAPTLWTDVGAKYDLKDELTGGTFDGNTYVTEMYEMIAGWQRATLMKTA